MISLLAQHRDLTLEKKENQWCITYLNGRKYLRYALLKSFVITQCITAFLSYFIIRQIMSEGDYRLFEVSAWTLLVIGLPACILWAVINKAQFPWLSADYCIKIDPYLIQMDGHFCLPTHLLSGLKYSSSHLLGEEGLLFYWEDDDVTSDFLWPFHESKVTFHNARKTAQALAEIIWKYVEDHEEAIEQAACVPLGFTNRALIPEKSQIEWVDKVPFRTVDHPAIRLPDRCMTLLTLSHPSLLILEPRHLVVNATRYPWRKIEDFSIERQTHQTANGGTSVHDMLCFYTTYDEEPIIIHEMKNGPHLAHELSWVKDVLRRHWVKQAP